MSVLRLRRLSPFGVAAALLIVAIALFMTFDPARAEARARATQQMQMELDELPLPQAARAAPGSYEMGRDGVVIGRAYEWSGTPQDLRAFYGQELPKHGWTPGKDTTLYCKGVFVLGVSPEREGFILQISWHPGSSDPVCAGAG